MSNIKQQDILELINGIASAQKIEAIKSWSSENPENAREVALYKHLVDELRNLSSYNNVDLMEEWSQFSQKS